VLEYEQLYADADCHGGALQQMFSIPRLFLNGPTQFF
jgi:hypothetical protein